MKIFISAETREKDSLMDPRFGRCQVFIVYDTETKQFTSVGNPGYTSGGGAGIQASNFLIDQKADILITGHLGPNAQEVLKNSKIKVYTSVPKSISEILKDYLENKLVEITN
ncbi:MAG TPA: NifB/NifX family molybdenum-iron cluster-binding protein [Clostridia bacterium]|nr:NifB/NifX family molybdenum-iron cluster-binding protein [Clostridia bacterium]